MSAIYNIQHLPDIHPLPIGTMLPGGLEIVKVYNMKDMEKEILTKEDNIITSEPKLQEIDLESTNDNNKQIFGYNQFLFEEGFIDSDKNIVPDVMMSRDQTFENIPEVLELLYKPYKNYYYKIRYYNEKVYSPFLFNEWKKRYLNSYPDHVKDMKRGQLARYLNDSLQNEYINDEQKDKNTELLAQITGKNLRFFEVYDYSPRIKNLSDLEIDKMLQPYQHGGKKKKTKKKKTKKKKTKKKYKKNTKTRRRKV